MRGLWQNRTSSHMISRLISRLGRFGRGLLILHQLPWVVDRVRILENRLADLEHQVARLSGVSDYALDRLNQMDLFKSSREVPRTLVEEFVDWKRTNSVPARPLVSVCVATYNRARLLTERCIPSILGQTYGHFEVIVVGDGCTDETEELIRRFHDSRLKFVNLPRRGHYPEDPARQWFVAGAQAMNEALVLARGDFITHLDDDDEYLPERLEKLVAFARERVCDLIWHPFWWEDGDGQWMLNQAKEFVLGQVTTSSVFYRSWFARIGWDLDSYLLMEPADWHRFRRIKYVGPAGMRYPEPLLRHYRERHMKGVRSW